MKKIILLLAFAISTTAQARETYLASYNFGVIDSVGAKIITANLTDEGFLSVETTTVDDMFGLPSDDAETFYASKTLHPINLKNLKHKVISLANAEIEASYAGIVCMLMPSIDQSSNHLSVARDYDYDSEQFNGEMTLVDGPRGCWVSNKVHLKNTFSNEIAVELKGILRALAIEALGDQIQ